MKLEHRFILMSGLFAAASAASPDVSADAKVLGLNIHQSADVGVAVTAACKGALVRVDFNWYSVEPAQGSYDWTVLDAVVNAALAKGFSVIATTGYTPAWAATAGEDDSLNNAVPIAGSYGAFVTAAVAHFSGRVEYWELWNEPNLAGFFQGTPLQYVETVLLPGAAAVHAGCSTCKVLAPSVATVGTNYADWMQAALTLGGGSIDIVTGHDYAVFDDMGGGGANPDFFSKLDKHRVLTIGDATVYADPLSLHESMQAYGASAKPFWMTETGYQAAYGGAAAEQVQAHFVSEVLEAMVSRDWWGATVFYEAFDVAGQPHYWGFSLADPDASAGFEPKPVCAVLAKPPSWDAAVPLDASIDAGDAASGDGGAKGRRDGGAGLQVDAGSGARGRDAAAMSDARAAQGEPSSGCSCRLTPAGPPARVTPFALVSLLALTRARLRRRRAIASGAMHPRPGERA